jgi:hypothetical protein
MFIIKMAEYKAKQDKDQKEEFITHRTSFFSAILNLALRALGFRAISWEVGVTGFLEMICNVDFLSQTHFGKEGGQIQIFSW